MKIGRYLLAIVIFSMPVIFGMSLTASASFAKETHAHRASRPVAAPAAKGIRAVRTIAKLAHPVATQPGDTSDAARAPAPSRAISTHRVKATRLPA